MFEIFKQSQLLRLMKYLKPYSKKYFFNIIGLNILESSLSIAIAFVLKFMIDAAVDGDINLLVKAVIIITGLTFSLGLISPFLRYTYMKCVKKVMVDIRLHVFRHLEGLPLKYYEKGHSGDIISRITNDIQIIESIYTDQIKSVLNIVISLVLTIVAMFAVNWKVASVLILLGIIFTIVNLKFANKIRKISDTIQKQLGTLIQNITNILAGFYVVRMFNLRYNVVDKYYEENNKSASLVLKRVKIGAFVESANYLMGMFSFAGIIGAGAILVLNGSADLGSLGAIIILQSRIEEIILQIGNTLLGVQTSLAGANRVFEILEEPQEKNQNVSTKNATNEMIQFRNVSFHYDENEPVLKDLSLSVDEGKIAALVGPSGGGKSTVIKLLMGFYSIEKGDIIILGKPISQYSLEDLRDNISYVPQDAYLFDGTIEENIAYGKIGASKEEIEDAAKAANAHEFIMAFPDGYNTQVGETGNKLSGGQKQRIAIARAIIKNSPILLLDEATSALDSESEQLVQKALNALMKNRTVIVVAHRLSTIENADIIYVLDEGKVVESGVNNDLLDRNGLYKELYKLQFKNNISDEEFFKSH